MLPQLFSVMKKKTAGWLTDLGFSLLRGMRRRWSISIFSRTTEREESSVLSSLSFVPLPGHLFFRWPGYFFHQPGLFLAFFLVRSNGKVSLGTSHHSSRSSRKKEQLSKSMAFSPSRSTLCVIAPASAFIACAIRHSKIVLVGSPMRLLLKCLGPT